MKRYKGIPAWILILLLLLPGTVFAEERAKITVESLDRGMELYILEAGETTLKSVGKDAVLTFENIGDRIYFYAGAKTGYQIDRIWGDGISDRGISELSEEVTDPGAKEAYGLGCTKYFFFTHSESDPQRTIHIEGSPVQYQVAYEAGDADAPADEKTYTVEEGSNTITLASSPSKQGFRFAGWQLGENLYQPGDRVTLNGDLIVLVNESNQLVFRACWTQTVPYTAEYYLESEKGVYPQQPAMQLECNTEAGSSVQADLAPEGLDLYGYVFDEKYEGNILSGIAADGAGLILRVYFALDANGNGIADRYEIPSEEPEEPVTPEEEPSVPEPGDGGETVPSDPEEGGTADPIPGPEDGENENEGTDPDPGTGDSSTRPSSDSETEGSSEADERAEADAPILPVAAGDITEQQVPSELQLAVRSVSQRESSDTDDDSAEQPSSAEETPLIRSYSLQEIGVSGRRADNSFEPGEVQTDEDEDTPLADEKILESQNRSRRGPAVYTIVCVTTVAASGALARGIFGYRRKIEALRKVSEMADEAIKSKK